MILYFCPDSPFKSAGIRILYDHVSILNRHGHAAAILHSAAGFRMADLPDVPRRYLADAAAVSSGDIVVIPEGYPRIMSALKPHPIRRIVIAMNWRYVFKSLIDLTGTRDQSDWRSFNIERALTNSPFTGDFIRWSMDLPVHLFPTAIDPALYYFQAGEKKRQISFLARKQGEMSEFRRVLGSRNRRFVDGIQWVAIDNLPEIEYARTIRESSLFLNLSLFEGLHTPILEAMRSGTLVGGYNSVGNQREMIGAGEKQNCILAETMDYVSLAQKLEPLLVDLLTGDLSRWNQIRGNAIAATEMYTPEAEEASVLEIWRAILA